MNNFRSKAMTLTLNDESWLAENNDELPQGDVAPLLPWQLGEFEDLFE